MLNSTDQKVQDFLEAWQANDALFGSYENESYLKVLSYYQKHAIQRTKWILLNMEHSGHFMVNRETEQVYSIKGYGKPNLKKPRGKIEFLTEFIRQETAAGREYTHRYWYALHPTEDVVLTPNFGKIIKRGGFSHPAEELE